MNQISVSLFLLLILLAACGSLATKSVSGGHRRIERQSVAGPLANADVAGRYASAIGQGGATLLLNEDSTYEFSSTEDLRTPWSVGKWALVANQVLLSSSIQPADTTLQVTESEIPGHQIVIKLLNKAKNDPLVGHLVKAGEKQHWTNEAGEIHLEGTTTISQIQIQGAEPFTYYLYNVRKRGSNRFVLSIFERRDSYIFFEKEALLIVGDTLKSALGRYSLVRK
jgi:hypothetical protein